MEKKYDIFISYRRQGGESTAKIISDRLKDLGHQVFYDVESLRSGAFNTKLYSVIEECNDVIVVLSPDSLDRCSNENDWVRLEIAHALRTGKNVIPVFLRGFVFPEVLPADIETLRIQNGLEANSEFFDAFITKLQSFLHSKPTLIQRIGQNAVFKRTVPLILAITVVSGIFLGVSSLVKNRADSFPRTQEQKNIMNETLSYIEQNLVVIDGVFMEVSNAYKTCDNYLIDSDPVQYEKAILELQHAYDSISKLDIASHALSENLSAKIDSTPVNKGDLVAVNKYNDALQKSYQGSLLFIGQVIDRKSLFDASTKRKIVGIYEDMLRSDTLNITYGINDLLLPVDSGFLTDFKQKFLPMLVNLPFGTQTWLNDKKELERLTESVYNQQLQQQNNLTSIVGSDNYAFMEQKAELEQYALGKGMSQDDIDTFFAGFENKSGTITELKQQLDEAQNKLKEMKDQARIKFAPTGEDPPEILWGKMLRFINLKLYEEAVKCAQMYQLKTQADYPEVKVYVPAAIRFINQISSTGVDYGVIVCAFEPGKTKHAVYETGDIIIAINDQICMNYDDFSGLKPAGQDYRVTLLRPDANGKLAITEATVPAGQPKVQIMDLTEKE